MDDDVRCIGEMEHERHAERVPRDEGEPRSTSDLDMADQLRFARDRHEQRLGDAVHVPPIRDTSRKGWSEWGKVSEKSLTELLRDHGVSDYQLEAMSKQDKGKMAEQIINMTDAELKEFMKRTGQFSHAGKGQPDTNADWAPGGRGDNVVATLKALQRGNSGGSRSFSERRPKRELPATAFSEGRHADAMFEKFWEKHHEELEKNGETKRGFKRVYDTCTPSERKTLIGNLL
jgi:hypothetical protein